ncbi:MAG: SUF system Fe-S cluster assembly regulator [Deltaproteobacteria bacterium]|nr:SUF system Fe-S cluster assembly regulator [Deltaproteobacteria bacterium]
MIRLAKLTDYGIALMSHVARIEPATTLHSARDLAEATQIPLPTVSKLLKLLSQSGLLQSQRGVRGGYSLTRSPKTISVSDVVRALEGPLNLTECGDAAEIHSGCSIEHVCRVKPHWQTINLAIRAALDQLTLADMAGRELPPMMTASRTARKSLSLVDKEIV